MVALTDTERTAWHSAYERQRVERERYCTQPVTPANPIIPRTPGQTIGTLRPTVR